MVAHMRKLSLILGTLALCLTILVGASWIHGRVKGGLAARELAKAEGDLSDWQSVVLLERRAHRQEAENAELALRNDEMEVQIAEMTGRGLAPARARRNAQRFTLLFAQQIVQNDELMESLGPDPRVAQAQDRLTAISASVHVYAGVLERDQHLGYAVAVLWLAFAFAWGLARDAAAKSIPAPEIS